MKIWILISFALAIPTKVDERISDSVPIVLKRETEPTPSTSENISPLLVMYPSAPTKVKHVTKPKRIHDESLPFYHPPSEFHSVPFVESKVKVSFEESRAIGQRFLESQGLIQITNAYSDEDITHIHAVRMLHDQPVANEVASVHLKDGVVFAWSSSILPPSVHDTIPKPVSTLSQSEAIRIGESLTKLVYVPEGKIQPAWIVNDKHEFVNTFGFQVKSIDNSKWYEIYVSESGKIVQAISYIHSVSITAIHPPNRVPEDGFDQVSEPLENPESPSGWTNSRFLMRRQAKGNNAKAMYTNGNVPTGTRQDNTAEFRARFDPATGLDSKENTRAALFNAFYVTNWFHDLVYRYGFNEVSGNYQKDNFGKGGIEGDEILLVSHSSWFAAISSTPPDGQHGGLQLGSLGGRMSAFENEILLHELGHTVSNRLVGGPSNAKCLMDPLSQGLDEGMADAISMFLLRTSKCTRETDFMPGKHLVVENAAIRSMPYSTEMKVNDLTYADFDPEGIRHDNGEIWASMLNEMYWNLLDKHGFIQWDSKHQKSMVGGNQLALLILFKSLKILVCNPDPIQARDAILTMTSASDYCNVYRAFAKRGLGFEARELKNDFTLPLICR